MIVIFEIEIFTKPPKRHRDMKVPFFLLFLIFCLTEAFAQCNVEKVKSTDGLLQYKATKEPIYDDKNSNDGLQFYYAGAVKVKLAEGNMYLLQVSAVFKNASKKVYPRKLQFSLENNESLTLTSDLLDETYMEEVGSTLSTFSFVLTEENRIKLVENGVLRLTLIDNRTGDSFTLEFYKYLISEQINCLENY
jgi:hypothetical protein